MSNHNRLSSNREWQQDQAAERLALDTEELGEVTIEQQGPCSVTTIPR